MDNILVLDNVSKNFSEQEVLNGFSLSVKKGEFLTLLGPSGCGKTTTLRLISGLEHPDTGKIFLQGADVTNMEPNLRNVNTVFQNYALFPHMNVFDNIAYPLKIKKISKNKIKPLVMDALSLVKMEGYEKRKPNQLSGGQKQRIAIARALISKPSVLLLDEPLGALDLKLRQYMQLELKRLQKHLFQTFIYVTHDQDEALNMSDRIAVMNEGALEQLGTPKEIYNKPATRFAAKFIGDRNILDATVRNGFAVTDKLNIKVPISDDSHNLKDGSKICLAVHSDKVRISGVPFDKSSGHFSLSGVITEIFYTGSQIKYIVKIKGDDDFTITASVYNDDGKGLGENEPVFLSWDVCDGVVIQ